jgi:hypothetical protein
MTGVCRGTVEAEEFPLMLFALVSAPCAPSSETRLATARPGKESSIAR